GRRAAQCAAPTGWSDFLMAGDHKGRPYGFIGALPEIWRAGEDTRPYGESGSGPFFFVGAGHWPARRRASAIPEPNLIRLAYARHLPLKGKDRKSTRLNSSHVSSSYAVFCLKKKKRT